MDFRSLPGLTDYETARSLMLDLVARRARDEIPDTVLFVEHPSTITRGRGLQRTSQRGAAQHMPVPSPLPPGVAFAESERGGDLTWHGPGQLVIYPIVKLDGTSPLAGRHDVTGFLRTFEQILIHALADVGITAERRPEATGVWVSGKKIASIGIAVRAGVTYHGAALNLTNDLSVFRLFSPCGFSADVMTRVQDLCASAADSLTWRESWEDRVKEGFERALRFQPVRQTEQPVMGPYL